MHIATLHSKTNTNTHQVCISSLCGVFLVQITRWWQLQLKSVLCSPLFWGNDSHFDEQNMFQLTLNQTTN